MRLVRLNIHSEETRHRSGSCVHNDLLGAIPWIHYNSLYLLHFRTARANPDFGPQDPPSGGADAVLMHAPRSLDSLGSVLQYGVLLVEDDSVVQLRHIVGWIVWTIDAAPLSD